MQLDSQIQQSIRNSLFNKLLRSEIRPKTDPSKISVNITDSMLEKINQVFFHSGIQLMYFQAPADFLVYLLNYFFQELHIKNSWLTRMPPSIRNLTSLTLLDIETSRISFLPDGVLEGMRDLVDLKIADSKLTRISGSNFKGLPKLKRLSLYKNNITSLDRVRKFFSFLKRCIN